MGARQGRCTVQKQIRFESKSCKWRASNYPNFFAFCFQNTTSSPPPIYIFFPPFSIPQYFLLLFCKHNLNILLAKYIYIHFKESYQTESSQYEIYSSYNQLKIYYISPGTNRYQINHKF